MIQLSLSVALDHVREKGKIWFKLAYKLFKETYRCDPLLDIYPFPTLIRLKEFLGGIQHFF